MRSKDEVRRALAGLGRDADPDDPHAPGAVPLLDWEGDSFRYGFLAGKLVALAWVLGELAGADLGAHHTFEDWVRELNAVNDRLRGRGAIAAPGGSVR